MKGEKQTRLSLATIEKSALLFIAKYGLNNSKDVMKFVWFLEVVDEQGLPKVREQIKRELSQNLLPSTKGENK